jgi:hypothetical protein
MLKLVPQRFQCPEANFLKVTAALKLPAEER